MTKDLIKYLISYYQDFVSKIKFEKRQYHLEANANYVFVGLRRAGKSYLMVSTNTSFTGTRSFYRRNPLFQF